MFKTVLFFSRRFRRKCTTLTVANFFLHFNPIGLLFLFICSIFWPANFLGSEKQESVGSSLTLNHKIFVCFPKSEGRPKGPPLGFFGTMRLFVPNTFLKNFFQKQVCFFCQKCDVSSSEKSCFRVSWKPLSGIFRHCAIIEKFHNSFPCFSNNPCCCRCRGCRPRWRT